MIEVVVRGGRAALRVVFGLCHLPGSCCLGLPAGEGVVKRGRGCSVFSCGKYVGEGGRGCF